MLQNKCRSFTVREKKLTKKTKQSIELNLIKENAKEDDIIIENLEDSLNENNSNTNSKEKFSYCLYYYEFLISFIIYINAFFSYTLLNTFHIIFSFILVFSRSTVEYSFLIKYKKCILISLLIIDLLYLIIKIVFHIINAINEDSGEFLNKISIYIVFDNSWQNIYDYVLVSIILLLNIIYLSMKNFSQEFWENYDLEYTKKRLKLRSKSAKYTLNIGIFISSFGASVYPSGVNFIFLLFGSLFFYSLILNKKLRNMLKSFTYVIMTIIPIYTILNYIANSAGLIKKFSDNFVKYVIIDIFNEETNDSKYFKTLIDNWNIAGWIPFICFFFGFYYMNLYIKCLKYKESFPTFKINSEENINPESSFNININENKNLDKNKTYHKNKTLASNFSYDLNRNRVFTKDGFIKLKESVNDKESLQSIFNTNIDCAFIIFTKEYGEKDIFTKVKMFLLRFCYTPAFALHIARLSVIVWVNCYITYASLVLIVWLLFSIKYSETTIFFNTTRFIIFPLLLIIFIVSYVANIQGIEIESQFFGMTLYSSYIRRMSHMTNKFIIISIFQSYIHLKSKHARYLKKKISHKKLKIQQDELEDVINMSFKGRYVKKPIEIFFKLYFLLLDLFVAIFLYLSVTQSINIVNEFGLLYLMLMFLLNHEYIQFLYLYLVFMNFLFLFKYILHFIYPTTKNNTNLSTPELIFTILFNDHLENIKYYWTAYYFIFLEYISQTSRLFEICNEKKISIYEIIEYNLTAHNYIKFLLRTLANFIYGIYIWLIIPCIIICLISQDNNCLFLFQLFTVFIIYYKYIQICDSNYKRLYNIFRYTWTLIFSTILNLIVVYIIQFLNKRPVCTLYGLFSFRTKKILEVLGLFAFNGQYSKNLFCFFAMFILSIALHSEIRRQIKLNTNDYQIKSEIKKNSTRYHTKKKYRKKTINEKNAEKWEQNIKKRKKETLKAKIFVQNIYFILYYVLHYYWIIIYVFIAVISFHWMLSVSMIIQISLFSYFIGKSFSVYYTRLKLLKYPSNPTKINQQLMRKEMKFRFDVTNETQEKYFRLLWFFTFSFIIISYLCSIVIKILKGFMQTLPSNTKIQKFYQYFSVIMYVLGFYSIPSEEANAHSFWIYSWGYFIIIGLFSIRGYLNGIFIEIKKTYFNNGEPDTEKKEKIKPKYSNYFEVIKVNDVNQNIRQIVRDNLSDDNSLFEDGFFFGDKNASFESVIHRTKTKKRTLTIKKRKFSCTDLSWGNLQIFFEENKKEKDDIMENDNLKFSKDDENIKYRETIKNKNIYSNLTIKKGIKKLMELLIIVLIAADAVLKCNILSFLLIAILFYTYNYDNLTTGAMFKIWFFMLFLLEFQYIVFASNLSYYTNTFENIEVINYIKEILKIPWWKHIGYRWATFFSLGTNRYQIKTLWADVLIIVILYFYLENFSYSIYKNLNETEKMKEIFRKYYKKFTELKAMTPKEVTSFIRAMKVSYNIELTPSDKNVNLEIEDNKNTNYTKKRIKILELLYKFNGDRRYLRVIKTAKIQSALKIKEFFYLSFHYVLLMLILLISLMNKGLIVLGYMSFSIYYIYKSHCFLKGRRWTLLTGIHTFMKPYLFFDIVTHFIFQIPFNFYRRNSEALNNFFSVFGYAQIVDYSSREQFLNGVSYFYVFLKILSYFLILVQENIYVSYDFKKFILKYHYEYLQKAYIKGKLFSFLFNNHRVKLMNDRLKERKEINQSLDLIQNTITNWNNQLNRYREDTNKDEEKINTALQINKITRNKKVGGITVGEIVRKHWLISLASTIFSTSFTVDDDHYNVSGDILKILKGRTVLNSELDDLIDAFEKKNYKKYKDIKNIKKILEKKKERLQKEKAEKKNKSKTKKIKNEEQNKSESSLEDSDLDKNNNTNINETNKNLILKNKETSQNNTKRKTIKTRASIIRLPNATVQHKKFSIYKFNEDQTATDTNKNINDINSKIENKNEIITNIDNKTNFNDNSIKNINDFNVNININGKTKNNNNDTKIKTVNSVQNLNKNYVDDDDNIIIPEEDIIFPSRFSTRIPHRTRPLFPNKLAQNRYDKNYLINSDNFIIDSNSNNSSSSKEKTQEIKKEKSEKSINSEKISIKFNEPDQNKNLKPPNKELTIYEEKKKIPINEKYIKLDQPYDDMFFGNADYVDLKNEIREDFFQHYCSKQRIILIILKSIFNFFSENFEYTVYFFMLLNHLCNGTASSMFFAVLVFLLGVTQYPRPGKLYWKIILIYCTIIIFLKFILQLKVWDNFSFFEEFFANVEKKPTSVLANVGLYKLSNSSYSSFIYYVIFDFFVLTSLIANQFILIRKGLWYMIETDYESIEQANDRIIKYQSGTKEEQFGLNIDSKKILTSNEIIKIIGKVYPPEKGAFKKIISRLYQKNFSHKRNEKPGKDFYIYYTMFQIFILLYVILLYTKMERDTIVYNVDRFVVKQFSGHMVICALLHVFLLVLDRFIYLKNTRKLKKIEFKVYEKNTGKNLTRRYINYSFLQVLNELGDKPNEYEIVSYQYEGYQFGLLFKFGSQVVTVFGIHIFIFFYLPIYGSSDSQLEQEPNKVTTNFFILLFYILYIFYFYFSAQQIKYGLPDLRKMSSLMKSTNLLGSVSFKVYKAIPFLFELKNFIDWTFTTTSLDLWKWLKFEEIISLLFISKCYAKSNMGRRVGSKSPIYMKFLMGGSTFFGVLLIVFGPLVIFSSLNPINSTNPVIGVNLKIMLNVPQKGTSGNEYYNIKLIESSNCKIENFDSTNQYQNYINEQKDDELSSYKKSYKYNQVQKVTIIGLSETSWDISPGLLEYLAQNIEINRKLGFTFEYMFAKSLDSQNYSTTTDLFEDSADGIDRITQIFNLLYSKNPEVTEIYIDLPKIYSPYLRLQTDAAPLILVNSKKDATLILKRVQYEEKNYVYWKIIGNNGENKLDDGILFLTFADVYSSLTFGYDVLTFYTAFVVVAGNLIRSIFLGQSERIMYSEMVNPNKLMSVCEGIKISRIKKDFLQEEKLYYLLIDIMRSPEIIKNLTQSSLIFIQDNNIVKEEIKYKEFEVESKALIK